MLSANEIPHLLHDLKKKVTISSLDLNALNTSFSLFVVIACFLHIIKMMILEGRLLEI